MEVHVDDGLPLIPLEIFDRSVQLNPRVVDERIEAAEPLGDPAERRLHRLGLADVELYPLDLGTRRAPRVPVCGDDRVAVRNELLSDRPTEAARPRRSRRPRAWS